MYRSIFSQAQQNYIQKTERRGFSKPSSFSCLFFPSSNSTLPDSAQQLQLTLESSEPNKLKAIVKYLEDNWNSLSDPYSFASYLVDELLKNDTENKSRWQHYIYYPWEFYTGTLYHGTKVAPTAIFAQGLKGNQSFPSYESYVAATTGGIGVSTSKSPSTAKGYALPRQKSPPCISGGYSEVDYSADGYIYVVDYHGELAFDIDGTRKKRGQSRGGKQEVNIAENIKPEQIIGAIRLSAQDPHYATILTNSNYKGTLKQQETLEATQQHLALTGKTQVQQISRSQTPPPKPNSSKCKKSILRMIKEKTQSQQSWYLGRWGSRYTIKFDKKNYQIPHGIYDIYTILQKSTETTLEKDLNTVLEIATKKQQRTQVFFFGRRTSDTEFFYAEMAKLLEPIRLVTFPPDGPQYA